jgi:PelA/Pel-15E family pectate lyase
MVTDTPLDAFRAGLLVPPELVVYSRKRIAVGQLTPAEVLASIRHRQPMQVSFRRLKVDPTILADLNERYLLTHHGDGFWHYLARHDPEPLMSQRSAQTLLSDLVQDLTALSVDGGYAGLTSADGRERFGEDLNEPLGPRSVFMRPLGSTPRVGLCLLNAYRLTHSDHDLQRARETARAVARTQHCTGAWASDATDTPNCQDLQNNRKDGLTLDEGLVAEAVGFLMDVRELNPPDRTWLDPVMVKALDFLVDTQKPNGAWPFDFSTASYASHGTINDDLTTGHIRVLVRGHGLFGQQRHAVAAAKGVEFLLRSQSAQGGWAQQYDDQWVAVAARAFEPAALSTIETAYVIRTLMVVDQHQPDARVKAAIQRAAAWLQKVRLAPGRWARFHQVETGKPLYADRTGKIYNTVQALPAERRDNYRWEGHFPDVAHAVAVAEALQPDAGASEALRHAEQRSAIIAHAEDLSKARLMMARWAPGQHVPLADAQGRISTRHAIDQCRLVQSLMMPMPFAVTQPRYWPP